MKNIETLTRVSNLRFMGAVEQKELSLRDRQIFTNSIVRASFLTLLLLIKKLSLLKVRNLDITLR